MNHPLVFGMFISYTYVSIRNSSVQDGFYKMNPLLSGLETNYASFCKALPPHICILHIQVCTIFLEHEEAIKTILEQVGMYLCYWLDFLNRNKQDYSEFLQFYFTATPQQMSYDLLFTKNISILLEGLIINLLDYVQVWCRLSKTWPLVELEVLSNKFI